MKLVRVVGLIALAMVAGAVSARAQLGVYGTVQGTRVAGITCPPADAPCASNDGVVRPFGGNFGAFYDFRNFGPVRLGADLRGSVLTANKRADSSAGGPGIVRDYDVLGGVRASVSTPILHLALRPYGEITAGFDRTNAVGDYASYTEIKGLAGLDLQLAPILDLRVIEFGAGEIFGPSSHSTQSIGIGVVLHTPR